MDLAGAVAARSCQPRGRRLRPQVAGGQQGSYPPSPVGALRRADSRLDLMLQPWWHIAVSESTSHRSGPGEWVLLSYRLPREPSGPRTTLWRRLKRLGVAQLSDGLVALPADARTRESLEWMAEDVLAAGGTAGLWVARPAGAAPERELATGMAAARA